MSNFSVPQNGDVFTKVETEIQCEDEEGRLVAVRGKGGNGVDRRNGGLYRTSKTNAGLS